METHGRTVVAGVCMCVRVRAPHLHWKHRNLGFLLHSISNILKSCGIDKSCVWLMLVFFPFFYHHQIHTFARTFAKRERSSRWNLWKNTNCFPFANEIRQTKNSSNGYLDCKSKGDTKWKYIHHWSEIQFTSWLTILQHKHTHKYTNGWHIVSHTKRKRNENKSTFTTIQPDSLVHLSFSKISHRVRNLRAFRFSYCSIFLHLLCKWFSTEIPFVDIFKHCACRTMTHHKTECNRARRQLIKISYRSFSIEF